MKYLKPVSKFKTKTGRAIAYAIYSPLMLVFLVPFAICSSLIACVLGAWDMNCQIWKGNMGKTFRLLWDGRKTISNPGATS